MVTQEALLHNTHSFLRQLLQHGVHSNSEQDQREDEEEEIYEAGSCSGSGGLGIEYRMNRNNNKKEGGQGHALLRLEDTMPTICQLHDYEIATYGHAMR